NANELSDRFAGMTEEQVGELATDPLFAVGIHTVDHPFLTRCAADEIRRQIVNNKLWIEQISGRPSDVIAYPGGYYNLEILDQCRSLGLTAGYALTPTLNVDFHYDESRIGIHSPSLAIVGFKAQWGNLIEPLRYQVTGKI